jgi:hypothetical protein
VLSTHILELRKSTFSAGGECLYAGRLWDGTIIVFNSNDPELEILCLSPRAWLHFIAEIKLGRYDLIV